MRARERDFAVTRYSYMLWDSTPRCFAYKQTNGTRRDAGDFDSIHPFKMAKTPRQSPMIPSCSGLVTAAAMNTLLLTMGPCGVRDCHCASGSSTSKLDGLSSAVACDRCSHPLSDHDSYC
ncbi:uncharacterized protein BO95DRAFT_21579 [Aspergillus brunneoviolaceus CBS 621.78]|uniref:Uncharacterized protein n=1 Tax=Aspergillus brunneoviolaceus CBS 621.78 TaxID=1450534 RepID=A0ACD1FTG1_9EURO|nr:hypothetical protein BO95DRAFT_21579 [Aspergillus brunneoviolaceus CBS 621.78]RAH40267.1 hypothetical protein BO95DRAFT_21579 [Aspergillus brunneoviolaceus CBS 621.78]